MAVLQDLFEPGTRAGFKFLSRIPGDDEGCQLQFEFYQGDRLVYDLQFGWTNLTIRNYIQVTAHFPVETLNGMPLTGLYMSFEKHLYQLDWQETETEGVYRLRFFGSDQDFRLQVGEESVRKFGIDLNRDWEQAPLNV